MRNIASITVFLVALCFGQSVNAAPLIEPRSSWATAEDDAYTMENWPPSSDSVFPVERIIVHDTGIASYNSDSLDPRQSIRSIYTTHAKSNGWGDIGYNYVIARDGTIFQARMGANGIRGAHLYVNSTGDNFNYKSIGISLLGRYGGGYAPMPAAMKESLAQLVGWLASTNGFDPREYFSGSIWNFYTRGYTSQFDGHRVVDHGDVERGNGDHNMLDMWWLRERSATWKTIYDNTTFQAPNGQLFNIGGGKKYLVSVTSRQILSIRQNVVDIFPDDSIKRNLPNGSLIRNSTGVGLLAAGKVREIRNPEVFDSRFKWKDVIDVTDREWERYVSSSPVTLREGMLAREASRPEVYIISDGKKRWIPSPDVFESMGFVWGNITIVPDGTLSSHQTGANIQSGEYPNGILIVNRDNPSGVEYLAAGKRRPIPTPEIFDKQFRWQDLVYIPGRIFDSYPQGTAVYFPDGSLIREDGTDRIFVVEDGKRRHINSPRAFEGMGYKWDNVVQVSRGGLLGMPEGTPLTESAIGRF